MKGIRRQYLHVAIFNTVRNGRKSWPGSCHFRKEWVVDIEENGFSVGGDVVVKPAFCRHHALKAAEAQEMGLADVGDEAVVWVCDFHQLCDVVGMVGSHLDYRQFGVVPDGKQGQGHTYVIVQVAFCRRDAVLAGENLTYEFLRRSFSVGSRKSYDSQTFAFDQAVLPVMMGQSLERRKGIRHGDYAAVSARISAALLHNCIRRPCLQGLERIFIAVKIFTFQREEKFTAVYAPAVRSDARAGAEDVIQ